jgi:HAMP domain-containing protein
MIQLLTLLALGYGATFLIVNTTINAAEIAHQVAKQKRYRKVRAKKHR